MVSNKKHLEFWTDLHASNEDLTDSMEHNLLVRDRNPKACGADPYPAATQYQVLAVIKFNKDIEPGIHVSSLDPSWSN